MADNLCLLMDVEKVVENKKALIELLKKHFIYILY
jgi:hypothetical protein